MSLLLSREQWLSKLHTKRSPSQSKYLVFYSSYLEAATTAAELMQIPINDHLVHRGHGVYDTGTVVHGKLYQFSNHVDRLLASAANSGINHSFAQSQILCITQCLVEITCKDYPDINGCCSVRMWLSPGPGDFGITTAKCEEPCLYILLYLSTSYPPLFTPIKEISISAKEIPMKSTASAQTKSVDYRLNSQMAHLAKERGGVLGIWVDEQGFVREGSVNNVSIVVNGEFITPPFHGILRGCTILHIMEILEKELGVACKENSFKLEDLYAADEVIISGGDIHIYGVVSVDNKIIGDGNIGPITNKISQIIHSETHSV
jgi:4-amino-4-deoxychorismate lyase